LDEPIGLAFAVKADSLYRQTTPRPEPIRRGLFFGSCMGARSTISKSCTIFLICLAIWLPAIGSADMVTDQFGRKVNIPEHPQRIVSLAPSITEIIFSLDLDERLVGATQFSDYPPRAASLPKVGSYVHLDLERIVALNPDLCIAVKDGNPIAVVRKLEALKIPVYAVDPRNLEAVLDTLRELGGLLGVHDRAEEIVVEMAGRIRQVRRQSACTDKRPGVFFQIGVSPIVSVGTPTFIHELIVMAGGVNLSRGPIPYPRFSKEQVLGLQPEVMIITSMARETVFAEVKAQWQQWSEMPAVKNDRIHLVDSNVFDRASPRLIQGLELLARLIHPNCFPTTVKGEIQ